jgi:hypothetical protein
VFSFITLITYLFSFYSSLVLFAFVLACACVPPSPHPSVHVLLAYQHRDSSLILLDYVQRQNVTQDSFPFIGWPSAYSNPYLSIIYWFFFLIL